MKDCLPKAQRLSMNQIKGAMIMFPCIPASEIEGTLELYELYREVEDTSTLDVPMPYIDANPSEDDVKFIKRAREVANESPDDRTQVSVASYAYSIA